MTNLKILTSDILAIIFPIKCSYCGLLSNNYLCEECESLLTQYEPECFVTRRSSRNWSILGKNTTGIEKVYYFYKYSDPIHNLILSLKYKFHKDKVREVIRLITNAKHFKEIDFSEITYITYVPISKKREAWRGFNQCQLIAKELSQQFSIPYFTLLEKVRNTNPQIEQDRKNRLTNVRSSFRVKNDLPVTLKSESILIIDDICTTGSTLIECARTIKKEYPDVKIYGLCLARGE